MGGPVHDRADVLVEQADHLDALPVQDVAPVHVLRVGGLVGDRFMRTGGEPSGVIRWSSVRLSHCSVPVSAVMSEGGAPSRRSVPSSCQPTATSSMR